MPFSFRRWDGGDLGSFCAGLPDADMLEQRLTRNLAAGTVRPEWCWLALADDGDVLARHHWWGPPGATAPIVFVSLDATDGAAALALLRHARAAVGVREAWSEVTIPSGEDGDPWTRHPDQVALLEGAGFEYQVDRVHIERVTAEPPDPTPSRVSLRPAGELGTDRLLELFADVADGSLDHSMRTDRVRLGRAGEANKRLTFDMNYPGVEDRFVVGLDDRGDPVGYVVPSLQDDLGVIAEIGVARAHRGRGYVNDLLGHATRTLVGDGAQRIIADTDCANTPMRRAFERHGYQEFARRWDWGWRAGG